MANCVKCGNQTKNIKFCSRSCSNAFNNSISPKRIKKQRFCIDCNVTLKWKIKGYLCEKCVDGRLSSFQKVSKLPLDEIRMLTLFDIQKRFGEKSFGRNRNATVRYYANLLNPTLRNDFGKCQFCGYNKHVELCHIKDISSFNDDATLEEINGEKNLLVLCPNHHWEFDSGLLELQNIPTRN